VGKVEKPLMTEKVTKLRCFENLKINNLQVVWRNRKKAWMTSAAMEEWLNMFNAKMKKGNRNAIAWFPANATSVLQPIDMGVIYTFKSYYRRFLMRSLISNVEEADSSYALERSLSVLDAVNWVGLAVKKIKAETLRKCFTGFKESDVADNLEDVNENIAALSNLLQGK
jgi:hypothetical protein